MINNNVNKYTSSSRILPLDLLKALGIVMVVFIHCVHLVYDKPEEMLLYQLCCLIADPIFFFVSGYLFCNKDYLNGRVFSFIKKQLQLMVVFTIYAALKCLIHIRYYDVNILNIFLHPHLGLWFILSLFFVKLVAFLSCILNKLFFKSGNTGLCSILLFVLLIFLFLPVYLLAGDIFDIGHTIAYSSFFGLGWLICFFQDFTLFRLEHKKVGLLLAPLFLILFTSFFVLFWLNSMFLSRNFLIVIYRLSISSFGVLFLYFLFSLVFNRNKVRFLSKLGAYSLGVYFFSSLTIEIGNVYFGLNNYPHDGFVPRLLLFFFLIMLLSSLMSLLWYSFHEYIKKKASIFLQSHLKKEVF